MLEIETTKEKNSEMRKAFAKKVEKIVGIIQQNLQNHGGNIELVAVDADNAVKLRLQCDGDCPEAAQVLETGIKELLKQRVPAIKEVATVD